MGYTGSQIVASKTRQSDRSDFLQGRLNRSFVLLNVCLAGLYFYIIAFGFMPGNHLLFYTLIAGELYHVMQTASYCYTIWQRRATVKPDHEFVEPVDVFITVCGEPLDIVADTVRAAQAMEYPIFTVTILNDGYVRHKDNWHAVTKLAKELGVDCITRRIPGGAKAGNINRGLRDTSSPYVAIFDADHAPHRAFLQQTMGYFHDLKVGFVQTPQYYRNHRLNVVTRTAWRQQSLFFGPIMSGKNRHNAAFMCGTNMVVRRSTLTDVGGMNEDNIVEDFLTSLQIHSKGWRSVYVAKVLAEGLAPEDFESYYKQQYRWARGSLGVLLKHNILFRRGLTLNQRLQYLSSALYYVSGVVVILDALLPLIFLYSGIIAVNTSSMALAAIFLPAIAFNLYTLQATNGFNYDFSAISFSLSSFGIQSSALLAALFNRKTSFTVTGKRRVEGNFWPYILPHVAYILVAICGAAVGFWRSGLSASLLANVAWALVNVSAFLPFIFAATGWRSPLSKPVKLRWRINPALKVAAVLAGCMVGVCLVSYFALIHASIRLDESQSLLQVNQSLGGLFHSVAYDVHVPLYHLLLRYWQIPFGQGIVAARVLSLVIFLATIPMVYLLARRIMSQNWALLVTVLVSFSPFMNWYANEARMYSLLALLTVINQYFFIGIIKRNKGWLGFTISAMFGIYSHYFFSWGLFLEGLFILVRLRQLPRGSFRRLAIVTAIIVVEFAPWLYYFHSLGAGANETPQLAKPSTVDLFNVFSQFSFGFQDNYVNTILVSLWPLLTVAALLAVKHRRRFNAELGYLLIAGFVPILAAFAISIFVEPLFISRYLIFCLVPLTIVLVWLVSQIAGRAALVAAAVIVVLVGGTSMQEYLSPATPVKEDYRTAVAAIDTRASAGDVVVVTAPFTLYPFSYYYHGAAPIKLLPNSPIKPLTNNAAVTTTLGGQIKIATQGSHIAYVLASYDQGQEQKIVHYFQANYGQIFAHSYSHDLTLYEFQITSAQPTI